jgi:hypothetical protein
LWSIPCKKLVLEMGTTPLKKKAGAHDFTRWSHKCYRCQERELREPALAAREPLRYPAWSQERKEKCWHMSSEVTAKCRDLSDGCRRLEGFMLQAPVSRTGASSERTGVSSERTATQHNLLREMKSAST